MNGYVQKISEKEGVIQHIYFTYETLKSVYFIIQQMLQGTCKNKQLLSSVLRYV